MRGRRYAIAVGFLCCACSFDGGDSSTGAPSLEDSAGSTSTSGTTSTNTSVATTANTTSTTSGTTTEPDPTTSPVTTEPPETTEPTTESPPETTGESTSGDTGSGETEAAVDCTRPRTYTLGAVDAELSGPMQLGSIGGIDHVFSTQEGAGQAAFRFDVECPSVYRLFARVRDDIAGVNNCCDPDSFTLELAGNSGVWFYGCDTVVEGFSWLPVEDGSDSETCDEPEVMAFELSVGEHVAVFGNREPQFEAAVAGIASVVLTNDPTYQP